MGGDADEEADEDEGELYEIIDAYYYEEALAAGTLLPPDDDEEDDDARWQEDALGRMIWHDPTGGFLFEEGASERGLSRRALARRAAEHPRGAAARREKGGLLERFRGLLPHRRAGASPTVRIS